MEDFLDCPDLVLAIETMKFNEIYEVYKFYVENCAGEEE